MMWPGLALAPSFQHKTKMLTSVAASIPMSSPSWQMPDMSTASPEMHYTVLRCVALRSVGLGWVVWWRNVLHRVELCGVLQGVVLWRVCCVVYKALYGIMLCRVEQLCGVLCCVVSVRVLGWMVLYCAAMMKHASVIGSFLTWGAL